MMISGGEQDDQPDQPDASAPQGADQPGRDASHEAGQRPFEFACSRCGHRPAEYVESCPKCGADMTELFSATYRVPMSSVGRKIALVALIGLALLLLLLLGALISQLLATAPPPEGA
ncbi:MAG TPA: hypothetical protein VM243_12995 [Phycisphaerae bacterium]|nr:hypothetical protein [Phycisphaerae bacterium]